MTPGRRESSRCELCPKYGIVNFNGRPLCWKHFEEALKVQVCATFDAWKAAGYESPPLPQPKPKAHPGPEPTRETEKPKKPERPPKLQGDLF